MKQPHQKLIPALTGTLSTLVSKSALGNWNVLALMKEATSEPKKEDYILITEAYRFLWLKQISLIYSNK